MDTRERMNSLLVAVQTALKGLQPNIWTAMPAMVVAGSGGSSSFNPAKMTVSAQPTVQARVKTPTGEWIPATLPVHPDCPVIFPGGGGFYLTFPLAVGDEGLLVYASRCIDAWWQSGGIQPQAEVRMHDLSDGFFLPVCFSNPNVPPDISTNSVQLRSKDGSTYVEIGSGQIVNIVAPGGAKLIGNLEVTGTVKADGLETGAAGLNVTGNIHATGTVTGDVDIVADGKSFNVHIHGGVQSGSGDTGPPL